MNEHGNRSSDAATSWWSVGALACLFAAGIALVVNRAEASFVLAALGALSWILNVRHNLPRVEDEVANDDEDVESDDEPVSDKAEIGEMQR